MSAKHKVALLTVLTALKSVDIRSRMQKMIEQRSPAVPVVLEKTVQPFFLDVHPVVNGFGFLGFFGAACGDEIAQFLVIRFGPPR